MPMVTVRYWAAAKQAAGVPEDTLSAETLAEALAAVSARRSGSPGFQTVLARSSLLVDGTQVGSRAAEDVRLDHGAVIEVLPPFAGG
ncbi:MAG TPA: MoaD/ThiS family protein [Streptosporangiaceae bacterium]|nr:MoaD/ThiS family protein [Streptosporangiaceae bacterium]